MDKRVITALAVAITLALAGLVIVQALWVRNTIRLKDAEFTQGVQRALMSVSERLEQAEALEAVRADGPIDGMLGLLEEDGPVYEEGVVEEWEVEDAAVPETASTYVDPGDSLSYSEQQWMFSNVVRGILSADRHRAIHERVQLHVLDSLLNDEFQRQGVADEHIEGVFDQAGILVLPGPGAVEDSALLKTSAHRVRLFRHDPFGAPHWLHVHMPRQQRLVLHRLWPMLIASALLVLLIGAAFVFTLRTIWQQKRLGDIRNDLVNNLTHELKTPISTIALACEALNDPGIPKSPEQVKVFTGMIRDENKRLGMLVESVLQSAVVDSGRMRLRIVDVDMHALLQDVVRNSAIQAENRGGRLVLSPQAALAHVKGDRIHLTNVFYNLVDNAVKYCEREPVVSITTESDSTAITVHVRDNGIGIPKTDQRKVFERLYRVPTGNVHNVKGFGLGLSYVRSVVERHGGRIALESTPGVGSTFSITIPFEHGQRDQASALRG